MILVVSTRRDEHADTVLGHLDRFGVSAHLLDLSEFPQRLRVALQYQPDDVEVSRFLLPSGSDIDLASVKTVWWRRPQPPQIDDAIRRPGHRAFAYGEAHEALSGLWLSLDAHWVNHPTATETAGRKAYQLRLAQRLGLPIPRTCITNDPDTARRFIDAVQGKVVYKAFSATEQEWRETRILRDAELSALDTVAYTPVIFQEYIDAAVDLRITIIGDQVFPAAIYSQATSYPVDFRMDMNRARIEPTELPEPFERQLREMMCHLGIVYGAVDARRTPDGRHVFLEVNPAGQWLFVEQRTGQPMSEALARHLAFGNSRG
jgi:hypothetical protein